jgi:phosphoesterase RecJ-like protein
MYLVPSPPLDAEQERAVDVFRRADRFLLAGHVRPDGDCIGAQAALARVLLALGKEVTIVNPDPAEEQFDYLTRECSYRVFDGGALPAHDVACLLDISELERCGNLAEPLRSARSTKVVIDHHVFQGERWWDAAFLDVGASATGLLVYRVARALGVALDPVAAQGVFTSLVTDTGWFRYSNTDAETLAVASELVAGGVDPSRLFKAIFQRNDPRQPRAIAELLGRLEYSVDGRLAVVDWPLCNGTESALHDGDLVLDILRSVGPVEVVVFLRETEDGACKLSARSKGNYDVQALASEFGGGGHVRASGATIKGPLAEVRARVVAAAVARFDGATNGLVKPDRRRGRR